MKLSDANHVDRLVRQRRELVDALEKATSKGLGVTIEGRYQDEEMLKAVRASVQAELNRRIEAVDLQLTSLGVTIDR